MPARRHINAPSMGRRIFLYGLAAIAAVAPLVTWGVRQVPTLVESSGVGSTTVKISASPLVDAVATVIDDAAINTHTITDVLHPLRGFVKDITRDESFSQSALIWPGDDNPQLYVCAECENGSFGPWFHADSYGPMNDSGQSDIELLFAEPTHRVQVSTVGLNLLKDLDFCNIIGIDNLDPATIGGSLQDPVSATATLSLNAVQAVFVDGVEQVGEVIQPVAYESSIAGAPNVINRAAWGADEFIRGGSNSYSTFKGICIHHIADSNNYLESQGSAIVRGIYAYHAKTLGRGDTGYNVSVDKYGNICKGHYDDLDKDIESAHTGGFNNSTFGILVMGNHDQLETLDAAVTAFGEMVGWHMKVDDVDPTSTVALTSVGYPKARYSSSQTVNLPAIFGHRNTGYTSRPGNSGCQQVDAIRAAARAKFDGAGGADIVGCSTDPNNQDGEAASIPPIPGAGESGDNSGSLGSVKTPTSGEAVGEFLTDSLPINPAGATQAWFAPQN